MLQKSCRLAAWLLLAGSSHEHCTCAAPAHQSGSPTWGIDLGASQAPTRQSDTIVFCASYICIALCLPKKLQRPGAVSQCLGLPLREQDSPNQESNGDDVVEGNVEAIVMLPIGSHRRDNLRQHISSGIQKTPAEASAALARLMQSPLHSHTDAAVRLHTDLYDTRPLAAVAERISAQPLRMLLAVRHTHRCHTANTSASRFSADCLYEAAWFQEKTARSMRFFQGSSLTT